MIFIIKNIEIKFHYSFLFLETLLIINMLYLFSDPIIGLQAGVISAIIMPALIICHELCHMFVAQKLGFIANKLTLWGLGGSAHIKGQRPWSAKEELYNTLAGPLSNFILFLLGVVIAFLFNINILYINNLFKLYVPFIIMYFTWINLMLFIFNMLPVSSMDGGRILNSFLRLVFKKSKKQATYITTSTTKIVAILYILGGLWIHSFILILIGIYIWSDSLIMKLIKH